MKKMVIQINQNTKVSIVEWNAQDFNIIKLEKNAIGAWDEVEEKDLASSMQVYGYLEEVRGEAEQSEDEAREWEYTFSELLRSH